MDPQRIEELLDVMTRPKCEMTIPDYDDGGDDGPEKRPTINSKSPEVKVDN